MAKSKRQSNEKRYWAKVDKRSSSECWPWLASTLRNGGGGQFYVRDDSKPTGLRSYAAHRYGYELAYGFLQPGCCVLHTCDNITCQNPRHLRLRNGHNTSISCIRGHLFTTKNTLISARTGQKYCRTCNRLRQREFRQRNNAAKVRNGLQRLAVGNLC